MTPERGVARSDSLRTLRCSAATQDLAQGHGRRHPRFQGGLRPAAIAAAVEDALSPLGVRVDEVPLTPERIVNLVEAARR